MIKELLLIPFLILISYFAGRALCFCLGLFPGKKKDFFTSFAMGTLIIICSSFATHFLAVLKNPYLSYEKKLSGICLIVLMTLLYFVFVIMTLKNAARFPISDEKDRSASPKSEMDSEEKAGTDASVSTDDVAAGSDKNKAVQGIVMLLSILLTFFFLALVSSGYSLNTESDETLETVVSFLEGGEMFSTDPLKGTPYSEGLPLRHKILCLPGMYAVLADAFKLSPEVLVFHIMPAFWFFAGICSICALSRSIYDHLLSKSSAQNRSLPNASSLNTFTSEAGIFCSIFVIISLLFILGLNLSPYAQGFGIISSMWTGYAIRTWVLIPFMLSLLVRKKYIPALLPVLCEAFICRTQYGIGFSAIIYALYILTCLILSRFVMREGRRHA